MKLTNAQLKANELIKKYGLSDYKFEFDNAVSRFGYCSNTNKIISLSKKLTELNTEQAVIDTILHEIAHALTPYQNHNEVWQRVCKAIGGNGERCYDDKLTITPLSKWTAHCANCSEDVLRAKRNRRLHCGKCYKANNRRLNKKFKFKWIRNR